MKLPLEDENGQSYTEDGNTMLEHQISKYKGNLVKMVVFYVSFFNGLVCTLKVTSRTDIKFTHLGLI